MTAPAGTRGASSDGPSPLRALHLPSARAAWRTAACALASVFAIVAAFSTEPCAQSAVCNHGDWFVPSQLNGHGDRKIPCDQPKPGWICDLTTGLQLGTVKVVYDGDVVWTPDTDPGSETVHLIPRPVNEQGNTRPAIKQPFASVFSTMPDDPDHRVVRDTDSMCCREWRERGRWHRSTPFPAELSWPEACRRASWNACFRSQGHMLINPPLTAPTLQDVAVDGKSLPLTFSENLDTGSVLSLWAFHVTGNGVRCRMTLDGVAISGATVTLTLKSAATSSDTARVRNTKPSADLQQDAVDNEAASFAHQSVTNNAGAGDTTAPADAGTLTVTFDEVQDTGSVPAGSAFSVSTTPAGGTARAISGMGAALSDAAGNASPAFKSSSANDTLPRLRVADARATVDALDEGNETFRLRLSNANGAVIEDGEAVGTVTNADPLQKMWLSRFGRTVAGHVTDVVSDRLGTPLTGAQVAVGGFDGEVTAGILGADAEWNRVLAGVAVSVSKGSFDQPGMDSGTIASTVSDPSLKGGA